MSSTTSVAATAATAATAGDLYPTRPLPRLVATAEDARKLLDQYDTFLLDCDGVIWHGGHLLEGVAEAIDLLRSMGKRLLFVTNNSTKSRQVNAAKFASLGLTVPKDEIFNSSYATALYLRNIVKFPADKKVFIVGEQGVFDELNEQGISTFTIEECNKKYTDAELHHICDDPDVGAIVQGLDFNIGYTKLARAARYLNSPITSNGRQNECLFIATNDDQGLPTPIGIIPGSGSLLSVLRTATGRQPVVIGKPHQTMLDTVTASFHLDRKRTCMVGDRLDTDIKFGIDGGLGTLLVLTGVTTEAMATSETLQLRADHYISGLGQLASLLK